MSSAIEKGEIRSGWKVIAGSTLGMSIGTASIVGSTIGIYFSAISADFGWSMREFSAMMLPFGAIACVFSIIFGVLIDRTGVRPILIAGYSMFCLAAFGMAAIAPVQSVFLIWLLVLGVSGVANGSMSYARVVNTRFAKRRGAALGIMTTGVGIVGFAIPLATAYLVGNFGWRASYAVTGVIVGVLAPVALALVWRYSGKTVPEKRISETSKPSPPVIEQKAVSEGGSDRGLGFSKLLKTRAMWTIIIAVSFVSIGVNGYLVHIVSMLQESGFTLMQAALAQSFFSIAMIVSRLVSGIAIDRYFAPFVIAATSFGAALGMLLIVWAGSSFPVLTFLGIAMIGIAYGADADVLAYIMSRYFGIASFGRAYGIMNGLGILAAGLSPSLIAYVSQDGLSYELALYTTAALVAFGGLIYMTAPRFLSSVEDQAADDAVTTG